MEQVLSIARDITTLLLPIFLVGCIVAVFFVLALLARMNKIAGSVQEMTFRVNNLLHNSFFMITNFITTLFEKKDK